MNKLLTKSLRLFTLYSLVVLAISVPAYYYLVDSIWLRELDEHNEIVAQRIERELNDLSLNQSELDQTIELWNKIQPGTNIERAANFEAKGDVTYTVIRENKYSAQYEVDRFRGLSRMININGENFLLTVETNVEETEETAIAIAILTLLFFLVLVCGFLILNRRLSNTLWLPFRKTLAALKMFNLHSQNKISLEKSNVTEFEELNVALNKLIDHTISVYQSQKEFTENASHELQTPLAIIKTKLDLLLQKENLTERQYMIVEDINRALTRVSRINKNLLLLAKIDNQQFEENEKVDISELLNESILDLQEYFSNKALNLNTDVKTGVLVFGNRVLIEILINNLLLNAIRHTNAEGSITIDCDNGIMVISNSGTIALDSKQLFRRFKKNSIETAGSGLGLSIVEQICKRHQWSVEYNFKNNHHIFEIRFN